MTSSPNSFAIRSSVLALGLLQGATVGYAVSPNPRNVPVQLTGSSCLANQGDTHLKNAGSTLKLEFDEVIVAAGAGGSLGSQRAACGVFVNIQAPKGWMYRVDKVRYLHDSILTEGGARTMTTSYHFQGQAETTRMATTLEGAVDAYGWTAVHLLSDAQWSSCDRQRALVFQPAIQVTSDDGSGQRATLRDAELKIEWARCD